MKLKLTKIQLDAISKYLGDISKLVFAAAVLGFFIPIGARPISIVTFIVGVVITVTAFTFSVYLIK